MVVGKKEKSDVKYKKTADLTIKGMTFENQRVYGDKDKPNRRDIFPDSNVNEAFKNLPKKARVRWMGDNYKANLSFRTATKGSRIPVYQYFI